jgi:hypothetical protein
MKGHVLRRPGLWLILAFALQACAGVAVPAENPQPLPPERLATILAGTVAAAQTQTAVLVPRSPTPTVTRTPSPTPTPATATPTFFFSLTTPAPPATETSFVSITGPGSGASGTGNGSGSVPTLSPRKGGFTGKEWSCGIREKTYKIVRPKEEFSLFVTFRNTGTKTWTINGVDFNYVAGYRHIGTRITDFPANVVSGSTITFEVKFKAPRNPGDYQSFWVLKVGNNEFCGVRLAFEVSGK